METKILYRFDYEPENIMEYDERADSVYLILQQCAQLETFEKLYGYEKNIEDLKKDGRAHGEEETVIAGFTLALRNLGLEGEYKKYRALRDQGYRRTAGREMVKEA